jgi:glycerophosphoryl diester phosphodiesterase
LSITNSESNSRGKAGLLSSNKPPYSSLLLFFALFVVVCVYFSQADDTRSIPKPPRQGGVYVVAHRGAHEGIPENTLAAYAKAIELGADFVEIDTRTTKDGHIVSMHNSTVDGYTKDDKGSVSSFTLAELKAMDIGSRVGPEWKNERIPELGEILDLCNGKIGVYVDLKAAPVGQIANMLRERGMEHDAVWYVGGLEITDLKRSCPECLPMPDPGTERGLQRMLDTVKPPVIASDMKSLTQSFVETCHKNGVSVIVDDGGPESWAKMLEWRVDGIQTDHPAALITLLKERGTK